MAAPIPSEAAALLSDLRAAVGDAFVSVGDADRRAYARDLWPRLTVGFRDGQAVQDPVAIVRPADEDAVVAVLRACARHGSAVVPFGAGSGVCGGAAPLYGGVIVDLKRLDALTEVDAGSLQVECGPGLMLQTMEERLNEAGYTLGHFPSSIYCCSIGGCVAARGAGQLSSRYGKIEDMLTGLRVATPGLGVLRTGSLDPSTSVDWSPLFVGSEGTLGLITRMRLRVHPLPGHFALRGVRFPSVDAGLLAFREMLQDGLRPSVMRLYDPLDTWMAMRKGNDRGEGPGPQSGGGRPLAGGARFAPPENAQQPGGVPPEDAGTARVLGSVVSPGTVADSFLKRFRRPKLHRSVRGGLLRGVADAAKERVLSDRLSELLDPENLPPETLLGRPALVNRAVKLLPGKAMAIFGCEGDRALAEDELAAVMATARRLGGEDLGPGPGERWFRTRYHVSFKLPKLLSQGGFADTFETAAPWTKVGELYSAVRAAVSPHVLVLAHMSHAYHEGCSIYFTLAGYAATPAETARLYEATWAAAMAAAQGAGACLSHHHGIGVLKRDRMDIEHGDARLLWEAARRAVDPELVLNPGKLFPPERPAPGPPVDAPGAQTLTVHEHADGVVTASPDWSGVDLAAELALRGHYLPYLGRAFLEHTVADWLASPAYAAHVAIHGAWEHPLQAVEGVTPAGRRWHSGKLPRAATGAGYGPFAFGPRAGAAHGVTFRTLTPPKIRPIGFRFDRLDRAVLAVRDALRGTPRPLGGQIHAGHDPVGFRRLLHDEPRGRDGAIAWLCLHDPDGFAEGSNEVVRRLTDAGGTALGDDEALAWWEDHWGHATREGRDALELTGPLPHDAEIGRCAAVVPWGKALLLMQSVETLTGGSNTAVGHLEAPLETGCTVVWRFASTRKGKTESPSLVPFQLTETIRSFGARVAWLNLDGVEDLPAWAFGGRGTPHADSATPDATRLDDALTAALKDLDA